MAGLALGPLWLACESISSGEAGTRNGGGRLFLAFRLPIFLGRNFVRFICNGCPADVFARGRPVRVEAGGVHAPSGSCSRRPRKFCTKFVTRVAAVVAARASALRS